MKIFSLKAISSCIGASLLVLANYSFAGTKVNAPVYLDTNTRVFTGAMGSVHHTSDNTQFIGCYSTGTSISCQARNAAGTLVTCYSSNPAHMEAVKSIGDDSRLYVRYNTNGSCAAVYVYNYSYWRSR